MYAFTYVLIELFCIGIFLMFIFNLDRSVVRHRDVLLFRSAIIAAILYGVIDIVWLLNEIEFLRLSKNFNYIINGVSILAGVHTIYYWIIYTTTKIHSYLLQSRKFQIALIFPYIVSIVLVLSSYFTGWIYYIDESNRYARGSIYFVIPLIEYLYLLVLIVEVLHPGKNKKDSVSMKERYALLLSFLSSILVLAVNVVFSGTPIAMIGLTLPFMFIFINLQAEGLSNDALTGLGNRKSAIEYVTESISGVGEKRRLCLIVLDVDDFRYINNMYGHIFGDTVLTAVSAAVKQTARRYEGFCARYDNDEFLMVFDNLNSYMPDTVISFLEIMIKEQKLEKDIDLDHIGISWGYVFCDSPRETFNELMRRALNMLTSEKESKAKLKEYMQIEEASFEGGAVDWNITHASAEEIDKVTLLPKMSFFMNHIFDYIISPQNADLKATMIYFNIEHLRSYNEEFGFHAGDELLKHFAELLQFKFTNDLISRFRSDHFVVVTTKDDIKEKIDFMHEAVYSYRQEMSVHVRAGIYEISDKNEAPGVMCDKAKAACDSIKGNYSVNYRCYDEKLEEERQQTEYIINHFDEAREKEWIKVAYQPIINLGSGKVCAAEALARWEDPVYGMIMPSKFIDVLEKHMLVYKLDLYILDRICRDFLNIKESFKVAPIMSFNLSRLDFGLCDIVSEIIKIMNQYGLSSDVLDVEITESALSLDEKSVNTSIEDLHNAGFSVLMDDFGSGYSSLNLLAYTDFDTVKLDMLFLRNFASDSNIKIVIKNLVKMIKGMKKKSLIEGIETREHLDFVTRSGFNYGQGYYYSKPLFLKEFKKLIENNIEAENS